MNFYRAIGKFEQNLENKSTRLITLSIFIILAISLKLYFASNLEHPGHGDMAYYLHLAENLADGRGFVIDYIWHFLYPHENLTHYANDYWLPFTSLIISAFMVIGGKSLFVAILPSILFGVILSIIGYLIYLNFFKSKPGACYTAIICLFAPDLFKYSLLTDSTIYYAVFVSLGLLLLLKASKNMRFYILAAILAGIAHFTRQDGVLYMIVVVVIILFSKHSMKSKLMILTLSILAYLVVLSPLIASNLSNIGTPFSPISSKTIFLKSYEDIYSYSKNLSLDSYLELGLANIIYAKTKMLIYNGYLTIKMLGIELLPFTAAAILFFIHTVLTSKNRYIYLPILLFNS
jgi:4-amino-4-deoxy-L-arabinose transferase-like glycosyltransferase